MSRRNGKDPRGVEFWGIGSFFVNFEEFSGGILCVYRCSWGFRIDIGPMQEDAKGFLMDSVLMLTLFSLLDVAFRTYTHRYLGC